MTRGYFVVFTTMFLVSACGPGPYGFARYYVPTEAEEAYHRQSAVYPYGAVTANPDDFQDKLITWFGVIENVTSTNDGRHLVRLSHHTHKERHLCSGETSDTCRVTVNFKSSGGFSVLIALKPKDMVPSLDKMQPGTLMRVFGKVCCNENEDKKVECDHDDQGGLLLEGVYYRQWPARYYSTTRAASYMRR